MVNDEGKRKTRKYPEREHPLPSNYVDAEDRRRAPAILTRDLSKRYAEVAAVDSLHLEVGQGEVYGFLGRNGAGKTTTIRMLLGLIRPTKGKIELCGKNVGHDRRAAVSVCGSLVETATAYPTLTVRENLEIQRRLTGSNREAMDKVSHLLGLEELLNRRAARLSLGNKQRLSLARAVLHGPRLLILDEPANGLDPAGIVEIRLFLRRLADEEGVTIFISSHILGEISHLADRIGIIHHGRLIEEFDTRKTTSQNLLFLRVSNPQRALSLLEKQAGVKELVRRGTDGIDVGGVSPAEVARLLVQSGVDLLELRPVDDDLEARFLKLTGGDK